MHRTTIAAAHGIRKPTWSYQQVMDALGCSKRHVYNLFNRGDLDGFYNGSSRGLRIFVESVQQYKRRAINTPANVLNRSKFNCQQVMDSLGCSKAHVYNLYNRGDIAGFYSGQGRGLNIFVDSLQEYMLRDPDAYHGD